MPQSYIEYNSGLTGTTFSVPFKYISVDDVHALGYDGTYYTSLAVASRDASAKTITLAAAPSAYTKVRVYRSTATDQLVDFQNGSRLSEADLDTAYQQGLFVAQEVSEDANTNQYVNLADAALLANTSLSEFSSSSHTGDGTEVTFDLSFVPKTSLPQAFLVIIDGVLQSPVDAYIMSINPAQITFASAPPASSKIVVTTTAAATSAVLDNLDVTATGSTEPRSLSDRFADTVNVKDFGAVGDGVTDDTSAIQAAIDSGATVYASDNDTYIIKSEINIPVGTRFHGRGCLFKSGSGFNSDNMFVSLGGDVEFYDTRFDGGTLPTLGSVYDGTQTAKGCIWVIDPDPTTAKTGNNTKSLIKHLKFDNCSFLNQPSSWIYSINLSDVVITNCHFETKADEANSSLMGIVSISNRVTYKEASSWLISNNKFVSYIDSNGDGNVKVISGNGVSDFIVQGNNFHRELQGTDEGVSGLYSGVFIKQGVNVVVDGNTSFRAGSFVKLEQDTESAVISNNAIHQCLDIGVITQGGRNNLIMGNSINDTASYGIYVSTHPQSGSHTSNIQVLNNEINGVGVSNSDATQSASKRSAILVLAGGYTPVGGSETELVAKEINVSGNSIRGSTSNDSQQKTHASVLILSYDSGTVKRVSLTNNIVSGEFTNNCISLNGDIEDITLLGNTFTDIDTFSIVGDKSSGTITNLLIKGNVVQTSTSVSRFTSLTNCLYRGSISVLDNVIQHDMSLYSIYIGSSTEDFTIVETLFIDNNVFNKEASTTVYIGDNVESKIFSLCGNVIEYDGNNAYVLYLEGDDTNPVFEVCRVQNNTTQGRFNILISVNNSTTGHIVVDGNSSNYTGSNTGIKFTNSTALQGYIGLNRIKGTTPTDSVDGTKPANVKVWSDLIA